MDLFTIIIIAIGLSMDSFAVSIVNGFTIQKINKLLALKIAIVFTFFQTLMPFLGWLIGCGIEQQIKLFDHWLAFILLAFLGIKMIIDGLNNKTTVKSNLGYSKFRIAVQGFATSIDAFVIGISFAVLNTSLPKVLIVIALSTFVFVITGLFVGRKVGIKYKKTAYICGGAILFFIGLKILLEHLFWT